jgi:hypothetical protein
VCVDGKSCPAIFTRVCQVMDSDWGSCSSTSYYVTLHTDYWKILVFVAHSYALRHIAILVEVRRAGEETKKYGAESLADYLV